MSNFVRGVASGMLSAAWRLLPPSLAPWARAMNRELAEIGGDGDALLFAFGCLRAILGLAIAARLRSLCAAARDILFPPTPSTRSLPTMNDILARPRLLGLICGAGAVGMGLAYMLAAGAPSRYLLVNLAALVLGASAWLALGRAAGSRLAGAGPAILALAVPLVLTAWFGVASGGASRWVSVGPLNLQVSLILLPAMLVLYARRPDAIGTAGMIAAAVALAAQPDRAMAGVLLAGLLILALATRGRLAMLATAASFAAFGWTLLTPDALAAVPYVDQILYTAFDVHPLAGAAVVIGAAALMAPALIGVSRGAAERPALLAFGGCWMGVVLAAALGNYPTPLVGYGGSAVLGYLLSVALLPGGARQAGGSRAPGSQPIADRGSEQTTSELRVPHPA
ncbi:MAG TPA: hypothetical protein VMS43_03590 [Allosphingosinicella sp.]|nr:hypothetical protein [Allosphingosinicella sp.]